MVDVTVNITPPADIVVNIGDFGALTGTIVRGLLEVPSTVAIPNGSAATLASVDSTNYKAVSWDVYLVNADGRRYQCAVWARVDDAGSDAIYSESGVDDEGDWTGTVTADLDSGNLRLRVAGTEDDWTGYAVRNFMKA